MHIFAHLYERLSQCVFSHKSFYCRFYPSWRRDDPWLQETLVIQFLPNLLQYIRFCKNTSVLPKKRSEQTATERRPVCGDSFSVRCTTSKRLCVLSRYLQPMGLHRFNTLPSFGGKLLDQRKHVVFNGTPYFTCRPRNRSQASTKRSRCESRVLLS